jgi:CRISPR-associated protein (TIGR03986 family)
MGKENKNKQKATEAWQEKLLQNKDKIIRDSTENLDAKVDSTKSSNNQEHTNIARTSKISGPEFLVEVDTDGYYIDQVSPIKNKVDREARAPYNFVPLNDKVVLSDFDIKKTPFDKYHTDRFTGFIELLIEAKTPLYIRDTYTEDQLIKIKRLDDAIDEAKKEKNWNEVDRFENEKIDLLWKYSDFYSPGNGEVKLPGSTQRGMIRNLVEIVSFGKFENFEDKRLYFRGLADKSTLRGEYQNLMVNVSDNYYPKIKAGFLRKDGYHDYSIIPSKLDANNTQIYRANFDKSTGEIKTTTSSTITLNNYEFKEIYFNQAVPSNHIHTRKRKKQGKEIIENYNLKYALVSSVSLSRDANHPTKGFIICSGQFGKKHMHWIINEADNTEIKLNYKIVDEYNKDDKREGPNIVAKVDATNQLFPCFYIEDSSGNIISFGQSGMFRVPYKKTIGEHIPDELKDENYIDIPGAIFGDEKKFAGRVFFEDAFCEELDASKVLLGTKHPKILSGPKPTTFQHYLTQPYEEKDRLKHYNPDTKDNDKLSTIRGYKQYWHKTGDEWMNANQTIDDKDKKQYTNINPVQTGTKFTGRIHFENLSDVELGALLFALELPDGCCHKIGMGKPLGLGSIRITPTLHLSTREKRYTDIASEWSFDLPESKEEGKNIEHFKNAFATYVLNQLRNDKENYKSNVLWEEEPRMQELKRMLDFEHKPDHEKTRYMEIEHQKYGPDDKPLFKRNGKPETENEFRNRPVLPKPSDV